MPYLINSDDRVDRLAEAAIHLVDKDGIEALTLRRLAGVLRLSPSSLTWHLNDKRRIIDLIAKRIGSGLVRSVESRSVRDGIYAVVPDDDLLPAVRTWLALSELARADDDMDAALTRIQADLRHLLGHVARLPPEDDLTRDALAMLAVGIWSARCCRTDPLSADRARAVLRQVCVALGAGGEPEPDAA